MGKSAVELVCYAGNRGKGMCDSFREFNFIFLQMGQVTAVPAVFFFIWCKSPWKPLHYPLPPLLLLLHLQFPTVHPHLQMIENSPVTRQCAEPSACKVLSKNWKHTDTHTHRIALLNKLCSATGLLWPVGQCVEQRDINHSVEVCVSKH